MNIFLNIYFLKLSEEFRRDSKNEFELGMVAISIRAIQVLLYYCFSFKVVHLLLRNAFLSKNLNCMSTKSRYIRKLFHY